MNALSGNASKIEWLIETLALGMLRAIGVLGDLGLCDTICNSLKRTQCFKKVTKKIVSIHPDEWGRITPDNPRKPRPYWL
jgi:hypothetical protein